MAKELVEHKVTLRNLKDLIATEQDCQQKIYAGKASDAVLDAISEKTGENFIVLIIGAFSSGKSSMINALIGEELLPHGFLPETAVLGELHYGTKKRVTLYPKKGKWEGGDKPFTIEPTTEEIAKYVSLSDDDAINSMEESPNGGESDKRINAKFEKMIVEWPLDILKDGVVLVDSPGLNDPYSNDYIVEGYLPKADAIVYVMDSTKAYTSTDKEELDAINGLGVKNIVTGYTFYDIVEKQQSKKSPQRLQQLRTRLVNYMTKHTELEVESVHFLSSLEGLDAERGEADPVKWRKSGFEGFEDYLSQYLVDNKGKAQVTNVVRAVVIQADKMSEDAVRLNNVANEDLGKLEKRVESAKRQLDIVRQTSFNTARNYRNSLENSIPKTEQMIRQFITQELPQRIDLEGFTPETRLPEGISKLWPPNAKKKAKAIQDECQEEIQRRANREYKSWFTHILGTHLEQVVKDSTEKIMPNLNQISRELSDVTDIAAGYKQSEQSNASNVAVGVAFGLLTGDWLTGSMSAIYGKREMARSVLYQVGAGAGLGLLALAGAPITLPVIAVAWIGTSIAAILNGDKESRVERIKEQAVEDFRNSFTAAESQDQIDGMVEAVMKKVREHFKLTGDDMESALNMDIKNTENELQQMLNANSTDADVKKAQITERQNAIEQLADVKKEALKIAYSYGIKEKDIFVTQHTRKAS